MLRCPLPTCRRPLGSVIVIYEGRPYCDRGCAEWRGPDRRQTWRHFVEKGGPMIGAEFKDARDRISRWVEDAQSQFPMLLGLLDSFGRLQDRVEAAERDNERLRDVAREHTTLRERAEGAEGECERLRGEVSRVSSRPTWSAGSRSGSRSPSG
jgi:hypothetical protein